MVSVSAGRRSIASGIRAFTGRASPTSTRSPTSSSGARCGTATTPPPFVTKDGGAQKNAVLTMKQGIVTRGVLYDIARLKGVAYLEPGTRIFVEDSRPGKRRRG